MPFTFKLSRRLARIRSLTVAGAALFGACARDGAFTDPSASDSLPPGSPSVASVTVSPAADSGMVGQILVFRAALADSAGRGVSGRPVSWTSSDTAVVRVDTTGAATLVGPGDAEVRANGGGAQGRGRVKVKAVPVDSVSVSPASASVVQGGTMSLTATTLDSAGATLAGRAVMWSTSAPGVATVSSSGLVTGVAPGTATVTATSEGVTGGAGVTVSTVPVASVSVSPGSVAVAEGATVTLAATARDSAGNPLAGRAVTWASSATAVATVSAGGVVTGVVAGTATITATSGTAVGQASVTVNVVPVASVVVSPATASLTVGGTRQLSATPKDSAGNTLTGRAIAWASSNTAVATVSSSGLVTAVAAGTATITATSGTAAGQATVTVAVVPVASVVVSPSTASLVVGDTRQLSATPKDSAGNTLTGRAIAWASSNTAVATVSASGVVAAVAAGTAAITATSGGASGTAAITVSAPTSAPCVPTGSGVCRYVDAAAGNDANPGTSGQPYRTLQKAGSVVNPGDVVVVRNGTYTGGGTILSIGRSGTSAAWITFRAENRWGALIDGQNFSSTGGINISGRFVRVQGFEILGTSRYGVEAYGGSDVVVAQNHIHDIGHICTSSSGGIVGINAYVPNLLIEQNLVHDIGRLADGQNGCTTTNTYWQNHDHGIYQGEGDNLVVRNNVFYNLQHGWAFQRYNGAGTAVTSLQIVNNTFVGANPWKDGQIIIATAATGLVIANNIFYQPRNAALYFDNPGLALGTIANNLTWGASLTTGSTLGMVVAGNLTGDPRFVNAGAFDFHLQAGSPALGAGLVLSLVTNDFDGTLRLAGVAPDLGAFAR